MARTNTVRTSSVGAGPVAPRGGTTTRVSWGGIFAGGVVAVALMILFTTFGIGIGASILDPQYDANPGAGLATGSAVYLVVTQLIALGAGGFVAARLAGIPRPVTSALHGAAVWSVATIFLAFAAISGAGTVFGVASTALSSTASAVGSAGEAIVPDDLSLPDPGALASRISLDALPDEVRASLQEQGITEENIRQEASEAFRNVFSQAEQEEALSEARATLGDILQSPGDAGEDITAFFDGLIGGENAVLSAEDRDEALAVMERRLGVTPEEAESIVQSVETGIESTVADARAAIESAQQQAVEAAQAASDAVASVALLLSLASLLGLAAACGGAFAGKPDSMVGDRLDDHV